MKREFLDYVEDIVDAIKHAIQFLKGMSYTSFVKDTRPCLLLPELWRLLGKLPGRFLTKLSSDIRGYLGKTWRA